MALPGRRWSIPSRPPRPRAVGACLGPGLSSTSPSSVRSLALQFRGSASGWSPWARTNATETR
eukprot:2964993-Alexandrium_andersonii.AAC.1